jgi:hypothetical protein
MRTNQEQEGCAMSFGDIPHDFEFSLQFALGRIPNPRFRAAWRALADADRHVIAGAIRENLELASWRFHRSPQAIPNARALDANEGDPFDEAINDAIATCDGDPRATIKALLIANSYLEAEMRSVQDSAPVTRGRMFRDVMK